MLLNRFLILPRHLRRQWWPPEKLARRQRRRLIAMVRHAYENVPYYRRCFDKTGLNPYRISGLEDLQRIPITRKRDLAPLHPRDVLAKNAPADRLKRHTTGGSSGVPFTVFSPPSAENRRVASLMATFLANGYRPHQKIALLQANPPAPSLLNRLGVFQRIDIPYPLSIERQLERLITLQAPVWEGYPSRIGSIARSVIRKRITGLRPKLIITNSEVLTDDTADTIQRAFGTRPTNVYDAWEFGNIAWECPRHEGLHINSDRLIVEMIEDGKPVINAPGEVVITDLDNGAMPLIRYATGDMAVMAPDACRCGRTFPLLKNVVGRTSEKLIRSDGTAIMATIPINAILKDVNGLREFQAIQSEAGSLTIEVIADGGFTPAEERRIQSRLLKNLRLNRVDIHRVDTIRKTPAHKHRAFVSEIFR